MNSKEFLSVDNRMLCYRLAYGHSHEPWIAVGGALQGRAETWLVAHDLYHHLPGDKGTLAEELATLGAEYYVCFEPLEGAPAIPEQLAPEGENALARSAAGIVGMCMDNNAGPGDFRLRRPAAHVPPTPVAKSIFQKVEDSAVAQLHELTEGFEDEKQWLAAVEKFATPGLVAGWVAKGYALAKKRFPDQALVREYWQDALRRIRELEESAPRGCVLRAQVQGYAAQLELVAPAGDRFEKTIRRNGLHWERSCPETGRWYELEHVKAMQWWLAQGWTRQPARCRQAEQTVALPA